MEKIAIILNTEPGTNDALGKAFHALLYAKELKEGGHDVRLLFDAGGTKWVEEMADPENKLHLLFEEVKKLGVIDGVCDFCTDAFNANREAITKAGLPFISENNGHPSILKRVNKGYQLITL